MTTVFIAGSVSIKTIQKPVVDRIQKIVSSQFDIVVGDADGADKAIQKTLVDLDCERATVYCAGETPRNNVGGWVVHAVATKYEPGSRDFYTAKDKKMAEVADYGLMIWDAKSPGTLNNVLTMLDRNRATVVFVNKEKKFVTVKSVEQVRELVDMMPEDARKKADEKIGLSRRLEGLSSKQASMSFDGSSMRG